MNSSFFVSGWLTAALLIFGGTAQAQYASDCCCEEWGTISVGLSVVRPGGISALPIVVKSHPADDEGWSGKLTTLEFDWNFAWEIDVTRNLCNGGVLGLQYWGTNFKDHLSVSDSDNELNLIWSGGENDGTELSKVNARAELSATKVALNYSDWLLCGCNTNLRWYAGLTFYYFDSDVKATGFDSSNDISHFTKNKDRNYLIGPTTGIYFDYTCNCCLDFYLNTNFTLAYNSHDVKRIEGPIQSIDAPMDFHYEYGTVIPVVESALGVVFKTCKWNFSAEYGFKWFYQMFNSVQQLDDTNDAAGVSTPYDLSFHGFTLRVGRGF